MQIIHKGLRRVMQWALGFILFFAFSAASAAANNDSIVQAPLTREGLDELERMCAIHGKNDQSDYVLLTGQLIQTRFEGDPLPSCNPIDNGAPCPSYNWFPPRFTGLFVKTNHYDVKQRVAVHIEDLPNNPQLHGINFRLGQPYALCVKAVNFAKGTPHFNAPRFDGLHHLVPN